MKAVLYLRFSPRPNAEECKSLEVQRDRCRAYCRAHDWEIAAEYEDAELSGGRADNRPGLQEALGHACKIKGTLVCFAFSRFSRNIRDSWNMVDRLKKAGADLASVSEGLTTRGVMGKIMTTILALFADLELQNVKERTSSAMRHHQKNGRRMGRLDRVPYGWMVDEAGPTVKRADTGDCPRPAQLVKEPLEQSNLAMAQSMRAQGLSYGAVAARLNEHGWLCRGKPWRADTLFRILRRAVS